MLLAANVVINEVHYDPVDKTEPLEFIELHNAGDELADLSLWTITGGITYTFPTTTGCRPMPSTLDFLLQRTLTGMPFAPFV